MAILQLKSLCSIKAMIKVLIIEDEQLAADKLEMLLNESKHEIEVLKACGSIVESVGWLKRNIPDLIFCDIHLADGNAFSIFEQVELKVPIIFTTAYDQYALKAFEQNSIDYLLKPIDENALERGLSKYLDWQKGEKQLVDLHTISKLLENEKKAYKQRFLFNIGPRYETVEMSDVAYFYSFDKQTYITLLDARNIPIDDSLNTLISKLDPGIFFHINRNFIIHINSIHQMYRASKRKMMLKIKPQPPMEVTIPEEKLSVFKEWLDR
jgi:DNA-binding LytR/AlgR family response regulator